VRLAAEAEAAPGGRSELMAPGTSNLDVWASAAQTGELNFDASNYCYRGDDAVWWAAVEADWLAFGLDRSRQAPRGVRLARQGADCRALCVRVNNRCCSTAASASVL
jgi:hypothetical protein